MRFWPLVLVVAMSVACMSGSAPMEDYVMSEAPESSSKLVIEGSADSDEGGILLGKRVGSRPIAVRAQQPEAAATEAAPEDDEAADAGVAEKDAREVRSWFPESFLWQPLVETDAQGVATLPVRVPDQLTTWRVLALAHSRQGGQAGAVHRFDSRLPLYVDPVVPAWLHVGDRLELPVQAVNATSQPVQGTLRFEGTEALKGSAEVSTSLDAGGVVVRSFPVVAAAAGEGRIRADLESGEEGDAAERSIPVLPTGRPVPRTRAGTLSSERAFAMASPEGADPVTQALTVLVFPGPLAVLQAEVDRLASGAVPPDGGYGFALARNLSTLSAQSGVEVDAKAVRKLRLVAWQRVVSASRAPSPGVAADLLRALGEDAGLEMADAIRPRLVKALEDGQRGDGTWARQSDGALALVLVQTAYAAGALPADATGPRLRAAGAIERYARQIEDPYTAAVVLASGLASDAVAEGLREQVVEGTTQTASGAVTVSVPHRALNPWGHRPTHAEMLAWTLLALEGSDVEWTGDLVAELMGGWSARYGFGAGAADVLALEAVTGGLPGVANPVEVSLSVGGEERARSTLDPSQPKVPAVLVAATAGDPGDLVLRSDPPVPGLAFVATLDSWVPWSGEEKMEGVEVEVSATPMTVGRDAVITLILSAPSKESITLVQGLPAGATVDALGLAMTSASIVSSDVSTDRVRLTTRPFEAGEVMTLEIRVQPAFAGRFTTLPLTVKRANGVEVSLPPLVWSVAAPEGA